jgi:hypothetical protein
MSSVAVERGTGLVASLGVFAVTLGFLSFAVNLLVGWYATTTVTAVAHDAVATAAAGEAGRSDADLARYTASARRALGQMGTPDRARFRWSLDDVDGDGMADVVQLALVVRPPQLLPRSLTASFGRDDIVETVVMRIERPR